MRIYFANCWRILGYASLLLICCAWVTAPSGDFTPPSPTEIILKPLQNMQWFLSYQDTRPNIHISSIYGHNITNSQLASTFTATEYVWVINSGPDAYFNAYDTNIGAITGTNIIKHNQWFLTYPFAQSANPFGQGYFYYPAYFQYDPSTGVESNDVASLTGINQAPYFLTNGFLTYRQATNDPYVKLHMDSMPVYGGWFYLFLPSHTNFYPVPLMGSNVSSIVSIGSIYPYSIYQTSYASIYDYNANPVIYANVNGGWQFEGGFPTYGNGGTGFRWPVVTLCNIGQTLNVSSNFTVRYEMYPAITVTQTFILYQPALTNISGQWVTITNWQTNLYSEDRYLASITNYMKPNLEDAYFYGGIYLRYNNNQYTPDSLGMAYHIEIPSAPCIITNGL